MAVDIISMKQDQKQLQKIIFQWKHYYDFSLLHRKQTIYDKWKWKYLKST